VEEAGLALVVVVAIHKVVDSDRSSFCPPRINSVNQHLNTKVLILSDHTFRDPDLLLGTHPHKSHSPSPQKYIVLIF